MQQGHALCCSPTEPAAPQQSRSWQLRPQLEWEGLWWVLSTTHLRWGVARSLLPAERGAFGGAVRWGIAPGGSRRWGPVDARGLRGVGGLGGPRAVVPPWLWQAGIVRGSAGSWRVRGGVGSVCIGRIHHLGRRESRGEGRGGDGTRCRGAPVGPSSSQAKGPGPSSTPRLICPSFSLPCSNVALSQPLAISTCPPRSHPPGALQGVQICLGSRKRWDTPH